MQNIAAWLTQGTESASTSHGGFDNDELTRNNVIDRIRSSRRKRLDVRLQRARGTQGVPRALTYTSATPSVESDG